MITDEQFQSVATLISKAAPEGPRLVNAFLRAEGSAGRLLKIANTKGVRISQDEREFSGDGPFYIDCIDVYGEDLSLIERRLELRTVALDGKLSEVEGTRVSIAQPDGSAQKFVRYSVKAVCMAVRVRADTLFKSLVAARVRVYGYSYAQIESSAEKVAEVLRLVSGADAYVAGKQAAAQRAIESQQAADSQIATLAEKLSGLDASILERRTLFDGVEAEIRASTERKEILSREVAALQDRLNAGKNNETQLSQTVESLNRDISDKKRELTALVNDRSLISDEYKDYVLEGKKQSRVYEWFLYFSISILGVCSWQLYAGARRIFEANVSGYWDVVSLLLQRAPFAAALALLITVSWKLAEMFVGRIMKIHEQRLALARILVIAKDTVYSSMDGLVIPDEMKFKERIKLKVQMLKSHLAAELGPNFEYQAGHDVPASIRASNDEVNAEGRPRDVAES